MKLIYSNRDIPEWYFDDAKDVLEDMEEEITDEKVYNMARINCEYDLTEFYLPVLEKYFDSHKCVISGSIGRWNGRYSGGDVTTNYREFVDLLEDCGYIEIYEDDGCLNIVGYHHDGSVNLCIRELTDKGYEWYDQHSICHTGADCIHYLFDYNFNSRKPNIDWWL